MDPKELAIMGRSLGKTRTIENLVLQEVKKMETKELFSPVNWISENTKDHGIMSIEDAEEIIMDFILEPRKVETLGDLSEAEQIIHKVLLEVRRIGYEKGYEYGKEDRENGY